MKLLKTTVTAKAPLDLRADVTLLCAYEGERTPKGAPRGAALRRALERRHFKGTRGQTALVELDERLLLVFGLGQKKELDAEMAQLAAATAMRAALELEPKSVVAMLPAKQVEAFTRGLLLGTYRFDRYLADDKKKAPPARLTLCARDLAAARRAVSRARVVAQGVAIARDFVNEPAGALNPQSYARSLRRLARSAGLTCRVLDARRCEEQGMGALLQVGVGSAIAPHVVHLVHKPKKRGVRKVALIGKGVTFDAGGYNLKDTGHIETMKCDMAGSAAVVGAMFVVAALDLPIEVHGIVGLVENLVSGHAYKPGDVLRTRKGLTVEVNNTDAEGRLVLSDLLDYASTEIKPDAMIDVATLTGACVTALGPLATGAMSNDESLRESVLDASRRAGEKVWPLPLYPEYEDQLKSSIADTLNTGTRWGGALTAGLFLQRFVGEGIPWVHLDIAGPAYMDKPHPYWGIGGSGAAVGTLVELVDSL